ncbi:hypothetical protein SPBR_09095 [Sporothrix brasiliensis 5110]|uniref:Uncharacterized protein n=1 Tax=Sporothrix brasiliensis 5110 TaxID=1398154 RepID=A0A0C2FJW6_9PEZI|nr:uncharacterized protein SPBR_09095 [Sporothrix brasiliensis 5110]KIH91338.1 hypothetical protein SPBR_09095 [Sporothrix brasiliensis 5110]
MASSTPAAGDPIPPSDEEASSYFLGLPSQPRLIARTDAVVSPWTRPLYRTLCPVTDPDLIGKWKSTRESMYEAIQSTLAAHSIQWSTFLPLAIDAVPFEDRSWGAKPYPGPMPEHQVGHFLVVGVQPGTCTWTDGIATATACRSILMDHLGSGTCVSSSASFLSLA